MVKEKNQQYLKKNTDLLRRYLSKIKKVIKTKRFFVIFSALCIFWFGKFATTYVFSWQYNSWNEAYSFQKNSPEIAAFSAFIMIWLAVLFVGIFRNWRIGLGALYSLITIIMYINAEKMASRNTPFMPEDLAMSSEAGGLTSMINPQRFFSMIFALLIIFAITFFANKISKKIWNFKVSKRYLAILQILLIISSSTILFYHTEYIRTQLTDKGTTVKVDWLKTEIDFTNPTWNYKVNGFILGTVSNLQSKTQKQPENYSKAEISKIVEKYKKIAQEQNKEKFSAGDEKVNIVYVMSESFIDPSLAKHLYNYGEADPILETRNIMNSQTSGWAASSEYGGGTANVEFEALTGLSNFFINEIPYTNLVPSNSSVPSIVKFLKNNGYSTTALHPYVRTMYKRDKVYPNLGFENYKSAENFDYTDKIDNSPYISDESAFKQVLSELKNSKNPAFIHLVTMQNHMPYAENEYNENSFSVVAENGANTNDISSIKTYLEGISKSDEAMKNFINELKNLNEKTIVVFWGDHWPGIYGDMFEKELSKNDIRRTPMFIYSNFEKGKTDLGTASLNYTQESVLESANLKMSPFQYLLSEVRKKYPALTKQFIKNSENSEILKEYELIEYDILSGKKYSLEQGFFEE